MSRQRTRAQAKRKRRGAAPLTPEQRVEISLRAMRVYQAVIAAADRQHARTLSWMRGDNADYHRPKRNEFDRWELSELARRNTGKPEPLLRLPDGAYEAQKLMRYVA